MNVRHQHANYTLCLHCLSDNTLKLDRNLYMFTAVALLIEVVVNKIPIAAYQAGSKSNNVIVIVMTFFITHSNNN